MRLQAIAFEEGRVQQTPSLTPCSSLQPGHMQSQGTQQDSEKTVPHAHSRASTADEPPAHAAVRLDNWHSRPQAEVGR